MLKLWVTAGYVKFGCFLFQCFSLSLFSHSLLLQVIDILSVCVCVCICFSFQCNCVQCGAVTFQWTKNQSDILTSVCNQNRKSITDLYLTVFPLRDHVLTTVRTISRALAFLSLWLLWSSRYALRLSLFILFRLLPSQNSVDKNGSNQVEVN